MAVRKTAKTTKGSKAPEETGHAEQMQYAEHFKAVAAAAEQNYPDALHAWMHEEKIKQHWMSSGSVSLDMALGGLGLPCGRLIEAWGPTGAGKTSLALEIAWHIQRNTGKGIVFMDVEHKFDRSLLFQWRGGFDPNLTKFVEPNSGEEAFGIMQQYVQNPGTGLIILDSVSGIVATDILEDEKGKNPIGHQSRLIAQYLPKISGWASKTGVSILLVNQIRAKIVNQQGGTVNPKVMGVARLTKSGGNALDHWICVSLFVDKTAKDKDYFNDGSKQTGHWAKVLVYKNHAGPTIFKDFHLCLQYGKGFDDVMELVDRGVQLGIVSRAGAWYSVQDKRAQGLVNLVSTCRENPGILDYIRAEIKNMITSGIVLEPSTLETGPEGLSWDGPDVGVEVLLPITDSTQVDP
jgi:recombination protein RecA